MTNDCCIWELSQELAGRTSPPQAPSPGRLAESVEAEDNVSRVTIPNLHQLRESRQKEQLYTNNIAHGKYREAFKKA